MLQSQATHLLNVYFSHNILSAVKTTVTEFIHRTHRDRQTEALQVLLVMLDHEPRPLRFDCSDFRDIRNKFFVPSTMKDVFEQVSMLNVINFIKRNSFLRASAMLKHVIAIGLTYVRPSVCLSVRPSVRPSHAGTLSKRLNILSCFLHRTIAHSF